MPPPNGNQMDRREELFSRILTNQERELELRAKELELRKQNDCHGYEYSKAALSVQADDAKDERIHRRKMMITAAVVVSILFLSLVGFMLYCVSAGKEQVAMEIIKAVIFLFSGGAGGYALGKNRKDAEAKAASEE